MANIHLGDKVRLVKLDVNNYDYIPELKEYLGEEGTVVAMKGDSRETVEIRVEFKDGQHYWFNPEFLEVQEPKGWTGKVVCVSKSTDIFTPFTVGKVYDVDKGLARDNNSGCVWIRNVTSVEDLNRRSQPYCEFIEFKGFAE